MHIPDGFIDARTAVLSGIFSATGLAVALARVRATLPPRRVPLLGLAAAFIFAAQMLNFPVAGGTSGHLIGGVLAAVLLGPSAAVVVISAVLVLQCFVFTDGGITALGANIFNMALVAPVAGYWIYRAIQRLAGKTGSAWLPAIAVAAWCSTVLAAISCAGQLAMSGTAGWRAAFPAMAGVHALIGIGEALITTLILAAVKRARPELLDETAQPHLLPRAGELIGFGLLIAAGLVIFIAPFACRWPDGLEKITAQLGFEHRAAKPLLASPFADYSIPGIASEKFSTIIAGIAGTLAVFLLVWALARTLKVKNSKPETEG